MIDINNFILVYYKTDNQPPERHKYLREFQRWMKFQISHYYPNAYTHLLTNDSTLSSSGKLIVHRKDDLSKNFFAKLHMFGLLDEPAMYLDSDVILLRKFDEDDLSFDFDFTLYQTYDHPRRPASVKTYPHYNSGLVWVKRPNQQIVADMFALIPEIITTVFPQLAETPEKDWPTYVLQDEFVISYYLHRHGIFMPQNSTVGLRYSEHGTEMPQSWHFFYEGDKFVMFDLLRKHYNKRHQML